jgi:hypothetical protein
MDRYRLLRLLFPWSREREYLDVSGESTRYGDETQEELQTGAVMAVVDSNATESIRASRQEWYGIQNKAMVGLSLMASETVVIAGGTVLGLANHWFTEGFATILVGATVTPSWAAYSFIVQRVFGGRNSESPSGKASGGASSTD